MVEIYRGKANQTIVFLVFGNGQGFTAGPVVPSPMGSGWGDLCVPIRAAQLDPSALHKRKIT